MVYIEENIDNFDLAEALSNISEQRRQQALAISHEAGRRRSVLAYLLLKQALRREYGITENPLFEYGEYEKPFILGRSDIHFSLSHCREAVGCVVSERPVGIDVESVRPYKESLARYTMSDDELQLIHDSERPDVAFTRLWTRKEALQKLKGRGIFDNLKHVLSDTAAYRFETEERLDRNYILTVVYSL